MSFAGAFDSESGLPAIQLWSQAPEGGLPGLFVIDSLYCTLGLLEFALCFPLSLEVGVVTGGVSGEFKASAYKESPLSALPVRCCSTLIRLVVVDGDDELQQPNLVSR